MGGIYTQIWHYGTQLESLSYIKEKAMRSSGVLMHITSLPSPYGIGTMGKEAYAFVDFLKKAGQSYWQILPLTPTGYGDSPYQSCSAFAGNYYLIDLDTLVKDGLLKKEDLQGITWFEKETKTDYGKLYNNRRSVLKKAFARFEEDDDYKTFCRANGNWLPDFCLFMALKDAAGGKIWLEWDEKLKHRDPDTLWETRKELKNEIRFYSFIQYQFYKQWEALRSYAHKNDIQIIGDVPIYVPLDSADVWSNPELFQLDKDLYPTAVAGCPPDPFCEDGQLWGNPLYRWDVLKKDGYVWWINRMQAAQKLYDVVRLDHFRGFASYWSVPYGDPTAREGKWVKGPGIHFINAVKAQLPELKLIAEDLGFLTQEVLDLRDESDLPGMKVLGFAFDSREPSDYLPYTYIPNTVCYTGTHDNMTMRQWLETADADAVAYATEYMHLNEKEGMVWGVIRTAMSSVSDLCVVLMQDYLDLGAEARMNFPGTMSDANWTWRAKSGYITDQLAERILAMTKIYGRLANKEKKS